MGLGASTSGREVGSLRGPEWRSDHWRGCTWGLQYQLGPRWECRGVAPAGRQALEEDLAVELCPASVHLPFPYLGT